MTRTTPELAPALQTSVPHQWEDVWPSLRLYPESHGFVQNMMYDSHFGDFFLMGPNDTASVPHWWDSAEPLWVTAEKKGLRSALYWWDGCQVEIRGVRPTFCRKYKYVGNAWPNVIEDTREALLTALQLLENDEIQLVQIYYEPVDFYAYLLSKIGLDDPALWIGRCGPVAWPPYSSDLNPLDFFFWGHLKSLVYETPVDLAEDLMARIVVVADKINSTPEIFERVRQSFLRRCDEQQHEWPPLSALAVSFSLIYKADCATFGIVHSLSL
ncbi:Ectonucleotide pyrophosphatase/phosphodiesterase family member 6 [Araneus ventricosus]|uniref:glycerophosphocholine cholinephosphodiesterase n=1 Tax=Araneus ventricosus TaxID=182803 RepID=A0A4Y2MM70_ARAVE|nr:Ectonucleotide pyrophosphatase/phosphodiesterase family member 6 [Araneus ventricosus]